MSKCCKDKGHPDHSAEQSRLNRVSGQIDGVKKMIDEGRYCPDIMTQIKATRAALKSIEANILERHLLGCVRDAIKNDSKSAQEEKIIEIAKLFKKSED